MLGLLLGCATFAPNEDGLYIRDPDKARPASSARPAIALLGDPGLERGEDGVRLARHMAQRLRGAPEAPVLVLGDVFYMIGLVGACPEHGGASMWRCDEPGRPEDQLDGVFAPYRDAFAGAGNPVVGIGGNHDYYGGEPALENACRLLPRYASGWRYIARGCGLDDKEGVEALDFGNLVVFVLDSEPMIRDADYRAHSIDSLQRAIASVRSTRPKAWLAVATHHPIETHGSHNGASKLTGAMKDLYILRKTILFPLNYFLERLMGQQDPYELRYRAYRRDLYRAFRDTPVDLVVSGHDHSLQHVTIIGEGVAHQIVSGSGAHSSPVQRFGQDLLWSNRLARLVGLGRVLPAPRHELAFGLGKTDLGSKFSGHGYAVLVPEGENLVVEFYDDAQEDPAYAVTLER